VIFLTQLFGIHRRQQCIVVTLELIVFAEHVLSSRRRPSVAVFFVEPIVQKRQTPELSDIDIQMLSRPTKGQAPTPAQGVLSKCLDAGMYNKKNSPYCDVSMPMPENALPMQKRKEHGPDIEGSIRSGSFGQGPQQG
jgi:hypothetical protein